MTDESKSGANSEMTPEETRATTLKVVVDEERRMVELLLVNHGHTAHALISPVAAYETAGLIVGRMLADFPSPPTSPIRVQLKDRNNVLRLEVPVSEAAGLAQDLAAAAALLDEGVYERSTKDFVRNVSDYGTLVLSARNEMPITVFLAENSRTKRGCRPTRIAGKRASAALPNPTELARRATRIELKSGFGAYFSQEGRVIALILPPGRLQMHAVNFTPMELVKSALAAGSAPDQATVTEAFEQIDGVPPEVIKAIKFEPTNRRKGRPERDCMETESIRFEVIHQVLVQGAKLQEAKQIIASRHYLSVRRLEQLIGPLRSEIKDARVFHGS